VKGKAEELKVWNATGVREITHSGEWKKEDTRPR